MYAKRPQTHTWPQHLFVCVLFCFREVEFVLFFPKQGFLCVALAVLELILYTMLALNSEIYQPLPSKC